MDDPRTLVKCAYDEFAAQAPHVSRPAETPDQIVLSQVLERLEPESRVLDAGCGNGLPVARRLVDAGQYMGSIWK